MYVSKDFMLGHDNVNSLVLQFKYYPNSTLSFSPNKLQGPEQISVRTGTSIHPSRLPRPNLFITKKKTSFL